jgi:quinol monooxygenase YgiN
MVVEITVCRIKKDCEEKAQRICEQVHAFVVSQTGCVRCFEKKSFRDPHLWVLFSEFRTEEAYQDYLAAAAERDRKAGKTPLEGLAEEVFRGAFV